MTATTVQDIIILKRVPGKLKDIKAGDLFKMQIKHAQDQNLWSEWQLAKEDAVEAEEGVVKIKSVRASITMDYN